MLRKVFVNPEYNNSDKTLYLDIYHPYRYEGEKNPNFDDFSGLILDLKEKKQIAINYFFENLNPLLAKGFPIITVPSSNPQNIDTGITKVGILLAQEGRINATSCLQRYKQVDKKANGGNRDISVDLNSIKVYNQYMIKEQTVLLLDDVTTTGNSLSACERLLKQAGAAKVVKLALAKTASY